MSIWLIIGFLPCKSLMLLTSARLLQAEVVPQVLIVTVSKNALQPLKERRQLC
jgi:hypothetical protein